MNLAAIFNKLEAPDDCWLPPPWLFKYILSAISPACITADSLLLLLVTLPWEAFLSKS
jgi:hypothetical protein